MCAKKVAESAACIFDYLKTLDANDLDELYSHPPTCLIVFRELEELAKQIVHRLLFLEQAIPKSIITGWVPKGSQGLLSQACKDLSDLCVWHSIDSDSARGSWRLNKKFQESMKVSLFGGGPQLLSDFGSTAAEKHPKDAEFLDNYASERWDSILHFMVGSDSAEVGTCVRDVLLLSGLMKRGGPDLSMGITQRGFQFLLMDRPTQVLRFMLHYFDYLKGNQMHIIEALHFVFQLSFLSFGKSYPISMLSQTQQDLLQHMRELGLAYQRKRTAPRFYVTRLALSLAFGSPAALNSLRGSVDAEPDALFSANRLPTGVSQRGSRGSGTGTGDTSDIGYILVETNFRLYAYTDSLLKTALLSLFSKIRVRYPNLVVADITRDSVREALLRGISANQPTILPPTLVDQIRLWELERDRLFFQEGCLYEQFAKNTDFEMSNGYLLWECPERRVMVVSKAGHDDVRAFWKQKRPV
ncbi:General transcription factor IIH subunit 4 [Echinococcus granulosus]|uniref:General transcription factor IIH subunit 4 n=1 Tax=Echinococcus granulosus TaxID=6210 RepID=W6UXX2_ECHGR|nr:General transcription factor IIH subunit 4 [Echinococcus granulosus]EUB58424.1 General transcription factor IIH subunit 4 [Echinococcus granulosus]